MSKELFPLRDYQIEALKVVHNDLKISKNVLLQAIMGAGKTVMMARLINRYYYETEKVFLILAHKQELVQQFQNTFNKMTDIPNHVIGICCSGLGQKEATKRITIGTIQTYVSVLGKDTYNRIPSIDLLVIDECHRIEIGKESQYDIVINQLRDKNPSMRVLGITATPYRLGHGFIYGDKHKKGGKNLFKRLNHQVKYSLLKDKGHLMQLSGVVAVHESLGADIASVKINGDFVLDQLGEIMSKEIHLETAKDAIDLYCSEYKSICVFCCTIDHAKKLSDIIGDESTIVHSKLTPLERNANMELWKSGEIRIICSVNILVEGFDHPPLDCLLFARPTMSSGLFLQAIGRVIRTNPGKEKCLVVDLTDNTARFGTDLDKVKVSIPKEVEKKIEKEQGESMFKLCPSCEVEVHKALKKCDTCGYIWPDEECVIADAIPDMEDVSFDATPNIPPEWEAVESMTVESHASKSGKYLGKISFKMSNVYAREFITAWFCLPDFYSGYAVSKAKNLWTKFSDEPFPDTVEEFEFMGESISTPTRLLLDRNEKYPQIKDYEFDTSIQSKLSKVQLSEIRDEDVPF